MEDKNCTIEKEVEFINSIIQEAIYHGGDMGGAYFSNARDLNEVIIDWLKLRGIDDKYTTTYDALGKEDWISIVKIVDR